jgi:hypothetical protein
MSVNVPARCFSRPCRYLSTSIHTYKVEKNLAGYPINNKLLIIELRFIRKNASDTTDEKFMFFQRFGVAQIYDKRLPVQNCFTI